MVRQNVFLRSREILQYDSLGSQGLPSVHEEFPFLESLLSFQELDLTEAISMLEYITKNWSRFVAEDDKRALSNAMRKLGALSGIHIYFRHLYVQCYYRLTAMHIQNDRGSAEDAQMLDELRQLPEQLPLYQKQIQRFFELVLDVDSAGRSRRHRRQQITFMMRRKIQTCFRSVPSRSASSRWSRDAVRRCCTPPAFGT